MSFMTYTSSKSNLELTEEIHCWTQLATGNGRLRPASIVQVWQPDTTNKNAELHFLTIDGKLVGKLLIGYSDVGKLRQALEGIHQ